MSHISEEEEDKNESSEKTEKIDSQNNSRNHNKDETPQSTSLSNSRENFRFESNLETKDFVSFKEYDAYKPEEKSEQILLRDENTKYEIEITDNNQEKNNFVFLQSQLCKITKVLTEFYDYSNNPINGKLFDTSQSMQFINLIIKL